MQDVRSLLRLEFETLWVTDDNGRLTRPRTSERRPAPLLAVASGDTHLVWAISAAVADDVAGKIDKVLAGEVPEPALAPGWRPRTVRLLLDLLGEQAAPDGEERGPSFVLVEVPEPVVGIECWTSIHVDRDELFGLMPEDDRRGLVAPWAVAVANGEVAAVCETARSAPASVEAGVWTYEPFRGQGFGTAVTAAWARLAAKRVVFLFCV